MTTTCAVLLANLTDALHLLKIHTHQSNPTKYLRGYLHKSEVILINYEHKAFGKGQNNISKHKQNA